MIADSATGYRAKPGQVTRIGSSNAVSMRSDPVPSGCVLRVVLYGDSVLFGANLPHDALASTILQRELTARLGRPVWVRNVSAGGWAPNNVRGYVDRFGWHDPDAVGFVFSSHDVAQQNNIGAVQDGKVAGRLPSAFLTLAGRGVRDITRRHSDVHHGANPEAEATVAALLTDSVRQAPTFVFHNRVVGETAGLTEQAAADRPRGPILARLTLRSGASYRDLGPVMPADAHSDQIHLTAAGQEAMAGEMVEAFLPVLANRPPC